MAYIAIPGEGAWLGAESRAFFYPPNFNSGLVIAATGEKIAWCGRFWHKDGVSKNIRAAAFRLGAVTKAGGSGLTLSLQDVSTSAGPPIQPDETQDQTVAIANGNALFASNTWIETGNLSADRPVAFGELLAVVLEYDGSGRLGSDSVVVSSLTGATSSLALHSSANVLKTGGSWAHNVNVPNLVLKCDDGTYGTLEGAYPALALNQHTFKQDTGTADEYALAFQVPWNCKIDCIWAIVRFAANTADFSFVLSDASGNAISGGTVPIDANQIIATGTERGFYIPLPQIVLAANTQYYLSIQPTQTVQSVSVYSIDVANAAHWDCWGAGQPFNFSTRLDLGSFAAPTTTRRLQAGIRVVAIDNGSGGGGTTIINQNRTIFIPEGAV